MKLGRRSLFVALSAFSAFALPATGARRAHAKPYKPVELPVGAMLEFVGHQPPGNWLVCNGAALSIALYPELFAVIGRFYGGTETKFNLPPGKAVPDGYGDPTSTMRPAAVSEYIIKIL